MTKKEANDRTDSYISMLIQQGKYNSAAIEKLADDWQKLRDALEKIRTN